VESHPCRIEITFGDEQFLAARMGHPALDHFQESGFSEAVRSMDNGDPVFEMHWHYVVEDSEQRLYGDLADSHGVVSLLRGDDL
jgi:hypothetical protein